MMFLILRQRFVLVAPGLYVLSQELLTAQPSQLRFDDVQVKTYQSPINTGQNLVLGLLGACL